MIGFEEYRIIAVRGREIIELESGYANNEDAEFNCSLWDGCYPDYHIEVEKY